MEDGAKLVFLRRISGKADSSRQAPDKSKPLTMSDLQKKRKKNRADRFADNKQTDFYRGRYICTLSVSLFPVSLQGSYFAFFQPKISHMMEYHSANFLCLY